MADGQLNLKPGVVITPIIPVFGQEYHSKFKATLDYSSSSRLARANETLSQKIKNWKGEEKGKRIKTYKKLLGQSVLLIGSKRSVEYNFFILLRGRETELLESY